MRREAEQKPSRIGAVFSLVAPEQSDCVVRNRRAGRVECIHDPAQVGVGEGHSLTPQASDNHTRIAAEKGAHRVVSTSHVPDVSLRWLLMEREV